jgi:hypothetical protein
MAHFAEIDETNEVVRVVVVPNIEEHRGQEFLAIDLGLGGIWVQTSYNTSGGVHLLGGTPLRKNYAGIGYTYDETRDAFIPPKPFASWVLNEDTCWWDAPIPYPTDGGLYGWDEDGQAWVDIEQQSSSGD